MLPPHSDDIDPPYFDRFERGQHDHNYDIDPFEWMRSRGGSILPE